MLCKSLLDQSQIAIFLDGISAIEYFSKLNSVKASENISIYIHRSDVIPTEGLFEKIRNFGIRLYSVNWLGDKSICTPIPIGIPPGSFSKLHGDYIYHKIMQDPKLDVTRQKHKFYLNFDLTTNIIQRKFALETFRAIPGTFLPSKRLTEREHLSTILNSNYVISPPGAGADCYRTWETIYLGAIPIVLADFWPFSHLDLPVKIVKNFSLFFDEIRSEGIGFKPNVTADFVLDLRNKFR